MELKIGDAVEFVESYDSMPVGTRGVVQYVDANWVRVRLDGKVLAPDGGVLGWPRGEYGPGLYWGCPKKCLKRAMCLTE